MTNLKPGGVVVAVDGSPEALRAVQWAAEQAHLERRPLAVVTAVPPVLPGLPAGAGFGAAHPYLADDLLESGRAVADEAAKVAQHHRPGVSVTPLALVGEPREVLVAVAADAHLLVLGSRGRGPLRSKLFGSVGAAVSRAATCPVVVCRPGTELTVKRGVVVGADGTAASSPVIDFAFRQASLKAQPLTVVHCFWDELAAIDSPRRVHADEPDLETSRLLLAESVAGFRERYPEVHVTVELGRGHPVDLLSAIADQHDLVVVGRHPVDGFLRKVTESTATGVAERARTTVAVVPEEWAA